MPCQLPAETGIKGLIRICLGVPLHDELFQGACFLAEQHIHIGKLGPRRFLFDLSSSENTTLLQTTGSTYSPEQQNGGGEVFWADLSPGQALRSPPPPGIAPPQSGFLPPGAPRAALGSRLGAGGRNVLQAGQPNRASRVPS